jgi:hypothetical protein
MWLSVFFVDVVPFVVIRLRRISKKVKNFQLKN